ncbi:MAG: alpha/beta hydrolase [Rhodospirillales bacterium]|jgi:2,6-dihydroxypseudooxynicotine hydrolase|nr:alpha/beta hydrolase [Rhodospirillaceae bacterium]MDP6644804.1 alpha/beta hydrolase [Rhodospirillales bacterium]MDP6841383.1 alpha/beta hydrolase [Rhodospirillales bacterium]|tara:strand:+ start:1043 stop:2104 length:1062 start_codon:yes stop_codon:yes gene_type:complete
MAVDPKVAAVIERWAPRFISNGVPLTDYQEATKAIANWDDWCAAWARRAEIHEAMGMAALDAGKGISAGEHLQTAGVVYHFAKFVFVGDMAQMKASHEKAVRCRDLALPHIDPPGIRVEIPYADASLFGILRKPPGAQSPPVVVMCMGMDSAKEEMASNEAHFLKRGMASLAFDGPGQGEGEYHFAITPEYEKPVAAVIDYLETRDDLDASRIGLWGVSFGGYYAPRAAAFEPRAKACIGISGPFDYGKLFKAQGGNEVFRVRAHCASMEEAYTVAKRIDLTGVAEKISCPLLAIGGELDTLTPPAEQQRMANEASGPSEALILEGGNHCANNLRHMYSPQSADWMAGHLGAG